jgi:uncharacterized protein YciI
MSMPDPASRFESVWFVEGTYAADAAEARAPFRAEHVAGLTARIAAEEVVYAGSFPDVSASVMVVRADSEAAALDLFRDDVYIRNGVWVELRARPFLLLTG